MKKITLLTLMIFASISLSAQWGQVNNGLANLTLGAKLLGTSNTHIFSGTLNGGKMYRTNDNGNNWSEITPPIVSNVPECGYYFSGKYFSGLNSSMECVYYSTDNGTTWNTVDGGPRTTVVRGFKSLSSSIFAYTSDKGVYRSTDGGLTWAAANVGLINLNVIWMETINSKIIAATIGGGVFISSDNGGTWIQSNIGIAGGDLNTEFVWRMGSALYYTAQGGGAYSSTNEGLSWTVWTKPAIMGLGVTEVYRNGNNLYFESRGFSPSYQMIDSIYTSSDEGANWTNITDNLTPTNLNASGITEFGGNVFIAYNMISPNLGIYRRGATLGINENDFSDHIAVYPNPFNEKIIISNNSLENIKEITIYDVQGKLVLTETESVNLINTSALESGLYLLKIVFADNSLSYRKMIK